MKFKIGDRVSFLNESGSGVITTILNNHRVLIVNEDGFEIPYPAEQLVPLAKKSDYTTSFKMNEKWLGDKEEQEVKPPELFGDEIWEVDLHFHELFDLNHVMNDHSKLMYQIKHFKKCMDAALVHKVKKIIFIHGVGKGTLKQEIIHALEDYKQARCYDAPFKKYGNGALTVEINPFHH